MRENGGPSCRSSGHACSGAAVRKMELSKELVLPDRIELSTSPLPMECSTTELRQHARYSKESAPKGPCRRPVLATRTPLAQACGGAGKGPKKAKIGAAGRLRAEPGPFPCSVPPKATTLPFARRIPPRFQK